MLDFNIENRLAVLSIDDGKANAVSHAFIYAISENLEKGLDDTKAIVLGGREGVFWAGFHLSEFKKGPGATVALMLLAADTRAGARGEFKIGLNETSSE